MAEDTAAGEKPGSRWQRLRTRRMRRFLLALGPAAVLIAGGYVYATGGRYVSTENAYVKADVALISAKLSGQISQVVVEENRQVEPGDVLFRIDDESFRIALIRAEARLQKVRGDIEALKATYKQKQEELKLARLDIAYYSREHQRQAQLAQNNIVSEARLAEARRNLRSARSQAEITHQDLVRILADLGGNENAPVNRIPAYLEARAERDKAILDVGNTTVKAPIGGIASKVPKLGQYVTAGAPTMSIVATVEGWVEANFKETDLTYVQPGQKVSVHIDTYPGLEWQGSVDSIAQATGAEFSLLPAQNATGNWVKVVQRIPVRIALETAHGDRRLRTGMSVEVIIDTGHMREMPGFIKTALSWFEGASPSMRAETETAK